MSRAPSPATTRRSVLAQVGGAALAACLLGLPSPARAGDDVVVLAAASLTESLEAAATAWTARGNPRVTLSFDASSTLARQIAAGAPADAFVAADEAWMDHLAARGAIDPATRRDLLTNTLVVVVPARSTLAVPDAKALAGPAVRRLALAGEAVPAGRYARAALDHLGVGPAVADRVVSGDNVRSVLAWVATGEADAGLVYATDARVEPRVRVAWTVPGDAYPSIVYPAAVVTGAAHAREAAAFLTWCAGPDGLAIFRAAGFSPATAAAP